MELQPSEDIISVRNPDHLLRLPIKGSSKSKKNIISFANSAVNETPFTDSYAVVAGYLHYFPSC